MVGEAWCANDSPVQVKQTVLSDMSGMVELDVPPPLPRGGGNCAEVPASQSQWTFMVSLMLDAAAGRVQMNFTMYPAVVTAKIPSNSNQQ